MDRTEHEEVNFPLLIPENLLEKENALVARLKKQEKKVLTLMNLEMKKKIVDLKKKYIG